MFNTLGKYKKHILKAQCDNCDKNSINTELEPKSEWHQERYYRREVFELRFAGLRFEQKYSRWTSPEKAFQAQEFTEL